MALSYLGSAVSNLVITIPAYLNNLQRQAMLMPSQEWTSFESSMSLPPLPLPIVLTRRLSMNMMSSFLISLESLLTTLSRSSSIKTRKVWQCTYAYSISTDHICPWIPMLFVYTLLENMQNTLFCHSNVYLNWLTVYSYITFCAFYILVVLFGSFKFALIFLH